VHEGMCARACVCFSPFAFDERTFLIQSTKGRRGRICIAEEKGGGQFGRTNTRVDYETLGGGILWFPTPALLCGEGGDA